MAGIRRPMMASSRALSERLLLMVLGLEDELRPPFLAVCFCCRFSRRKFCERSRLSPEVNRLPRSRQSERHEHFLRAFQGFAPISGAIQRLPESNPSRQGNSCHRLAHFPTPFCDVGVRAFGGPGDPMGTQVKWPELATLAEWSCYSHDRVEGLRVRETIVRGFMAR